MCIPCVAASPKKSAETVKTDTNSEIVSTGVDTTLTAAITAAVTENTETDLKVSHKIRARLLNVCGSVAYLAGDATGAVACLRASLQEDPLLVDSKIKLGSLLIDMDESEEVGRF